MNTKYNFDKKVLKQIFFISIFLKKIISTFLILLFSKFAIGQFIINGEFRPRIEYRHGYKSLADTGQQFALFTEQRTRSIFDYISENIRFGITVQDIRTWGSEAQLNLSDGNLSVHKT